jgi:hypothetical protein
LTSRGAHFVRLVWRVPSGDEARIFRAPISARARLAEPSRFLARFLSSSAVSRTASHFLLCFVLLHKGAIQGHTGENAEGTGPENDFGIQQDVGVREVVRAREWQCDGWLERPLSSRRDFAIYRRECRIDISTRSFKPPWGMP